MTDISVNCKNTEIVIRNLKTLLETRDIFCKLSKLVENHKLNLISLIEIAKTKNIVDENLFKLLDDSTCLLAISINNCLDATKCHPSGLGEKIIQPAVFDLGIDKTTNFCSVPFGSYANYSCQSTCNTNNCCNLAKISSIGVGMLPMNSSILVSSNVLNKEIHIRYKFKNDGNNDVCFPLLWSGNININPSSIICMIEPEQSNTIITIDEFIDRLKREIKSLCALIGIFENECDRFNDNACKFKNQSLLLVPLCDKDKITNLF